MKTIITVYLQIIKTFDNDILLTLETSAPAALGLIASRDFVTIRRTLVNNDVYVGVGMSTDTFDNIILPSNNIRYLGSSLLVLLNYFSGLSKFT